MLRLQPTTQFRKDRKRAIKRGLQLSLLDDILQTLIEEKPLAPKHRWGMAEEPYGVGGIA